MTSLPKWAWAVLFVGFATTVVTIARWRSGAPDGMVVFEGVRGPAERSAVRMHAAARWEDDGAGDPSRLAILLTDPDSAWLGLVHGLRTIGVPFRITTDYHEALTHRVVLVYPTISGRKLDPEGLRALARFPETGGTLIGTSVEGGGLDEIFGFKGIASSRTRRELTFAASPLTAAFTDPREHVIRFSNPQSGTDAMGSIGYLGVASPLATFDDGTAAITARRIGKGRAYALGIDPGFLLLTG